ncbi:MAG: redoxin family protein [Myxococcota bacterium]|nr:redoxin family protein [Myxococcota bacterium]
MSTAPKGGPNWAVLIGGLLLIVPFIVILALGFGEEPEEVVFSERPAPDFVLEDLQAKVWRLSEQDKPVVLNFWATWCVPCKAEHPLLQQAATVNDDVQFLGVLYGDNPAKAEVYLKQAGGVYPTLLDPTGATAAAYGVTGVPESFFIDASGVMRYRHNGPLDSDTLWQALETIQ